MYVPFILFEGMSKRLSIPFILFLILLYYQIVNTYLAVIYYTLTIITASTVFSKTEDCAFQ